MSLWNFPAIEAPSIASQTSEISEEVIQITPSSSSRHGIVGGTKGQFGIGVGQNQLLRVSIEKGDLALSAALYGPSGAKLFEYRSHHFEVVEIFFPADVAGTYRLEIESHEKADHRSEYALKIEPFTPVVARDLRDREARQVMAQAEKLRASWSEALLKQSIVEYDKAALIWTSINDLSNASRATLRSAEVYFYVSKYPDALEHAQNAVTLARKAGDAIAESQALSHVGLLHTYLGDNSQAQKELSEARHLAEAAADQSALARNAQGVALSNLAEVNYAKGYLTKSSRLFDEARKLLQNDRRRLARVHLFNGYTAGTIGNPAKANAEISKALDLYQTTNDKLGEGQALTRLGTFFSFSGNQNEALKLHRLALEIFRPIGDKHSQAIALNGLGQAYERLKDYQVAISHYQNGLRIAQDINSPDVGSGATISLAAIYRQMGQLDAALAYNRRCLGLSRAAGKARFEAHALREIATIYAEQGRPELALQQFERIRVFFESSNDLVGQALALNTQGDLLYQLEEKRRAVDVYNRALPLSEKINDQEILLSTLGSLARTHADLGDLDVALSLSKRSLTIIENLRSKIGSPDLRVSYFSVARKYYALCVEILMQLEELRPGKGYAAEALSISDQSRARALVDLLSESQEKLLVGAPPELVNRERELRALIRVQAQYEMQLKLNGGDVVEAAEVATDMAKLRSDYQDVQLTLRERIPQLRSPAPRSLLRLTDFQDELREDDTMLLQFFLGEKTSYLWAITHNSIQSYKLPPAATIENAAIKVYKLMTARQETNVADYQMNVETSDKLYFDKASHLSDMLLGQVAAQLGNRRLIIVADGALQYTQFEALPIPFVKLEGPIELKNPAEFLLIGKHEIVGEPSFSALKAIRAETKSQNSPDKLVAIIADPVFSAGDDRVQITAPSPATVRAATKENPETAIALRGNSLGRLTYSAAEAEAINAAAPRGTTMLAKGFDANRQIAMSTQIGEYQIVHFATHGFFDSDKPELSSIVLSLVDRNGEPQHGLMPLHDINSLNLSAQVTVLSACQTALGKDIKGEGFVGLTQSFMSAGSKSVVASLWKVDDRATAILMPDFYQSMLQQQMTSAAALRSAKLKIMQDKQWRAPYYWAGFVLQGEYTNRITVDRNSSLRPSLVLLMVLVLATTGLLLFRRRLRA